MIIYFIICAGILVYGICYSARPMFFLKRKYMGEPVPENTVKIARVSGIIVAVVGVLLILVRGVRLFIA